jgi:heme/copper-type cytochrome/quinol oxidase subunit 2
MNKKEISIIAVAVIIVIAGVGIYYWSGSRKGSNAGNNTGASVQNTGTPTETTPSTTVQALPSNVVVPDQNASSVPAGVAAPTVVSAGSPSGVTSFRSFNISISGGAYTPNTVIVNKGDTVRINLTAVDGNYDFTQPNYGMSLAITKGQTKLVQFDANSAGKFTFYCTSCGGPAKGPTGYVEVVAK